MAHGGKPRRETDIRAHPHIGLILRRLKGLVVDPENRLETMNGRNGVLVSAHDSR